ncbi:RICIN domain-containing protein [Actinoplanes siamensis]|uniref:Ricin B lectin domain-containing protein n=1 Tax=Actinoplanes siamensis TaxID=1223317 RepID=A0A919NB91_9ACTN|nr:RICIN domain-containing protein [Actinoplanes siamensis]GIF07962.1 hypothetical protein Asi03nite_55000 [Actinoplanes siamensis]
MGDEDFGTDRDPLLVRPFLSRDDAPGEHTSSEATWPAGTASDSPTQVLPVFSGGTPAGERPARRGRRPLLLAGAGAVVVVVLALVGYFALRPALDPALSAGLPDHSLPAVTGPATVPPSADGTAADGGTDGKPGAGAGQTPGDKATTPAGSVSTTPFGPAGSASASAGAGSAASAQPDSPALAASPRTGAGSLVGANGLCLDVPNAIPTDENHIQVFDCNRSAAQLWTLADDGTLRVMGRCALVVGDDTVHLITCDRRTTALWRMTGEGQLINAANDKCLTDPSDGARPHTRVVVVTCTGKSNQVWSLR